jgi:pyruvate formate lyase activating enzyme
LGLTTGLIFDIKKFSVHDGPGIRTTVFFKGCPLRCQWCHNPESQRLGRERLIRTERCIRCGACLAACEQEAISWVDGQPVTDDGRCILCGACVAECHAGAREIAGQRMTVGEVMAEVERDIAFYDESGGGVTFSGGEPLMQPEFLGALLQASRDRGIHTALDTCGHAPWPVLAAVRRLVDLFLYDIKIMDETRHRQFTGVSNDLILKNLEALSALGSRIVVRVPVIPGINDDEDNLRRLAAYVAALPHVEGLALLPYHATATAKYERLGLAYSLREVRPPPDGRMEALGQMLQAHGLEVTIGG